MSRGGYRPGAGRPKGSRTLKGGTVNAEGGTPLEFLLGVVEDEAADVELRVRCAVAALPYCHPKAEAGGKRARQRLDAETAEVGTEWDALLNDLPEKYRHRRVRPFDSGR